MAEIQCFVEECVFNKNRCCSARNVEVRSSGTKNVEQADNTACSTFELG